MNASPNVSENPGTDRQKVRLKFRVSALAGVSGNGSAEPKWTEKWGVGLLAHEEFHVTDQLLKLPFQETPPKTVCVFSVVPEGLRFRMLDADRLASVNDARKTEAIVSSGDRIHIGDTLLLEVVLAPSAQARAEPVVSHDESSPEILTNTGAALSQGPANTPAEPIVPLSPGEFSEPAESMAGRLSGKRAGKTSTKEKAKAEEDGPTLTFSAMDPNTAIDFPRPSEPIFGSSNNTIQIEEPTLDRVAPPSGKLEGKRIATYSTERAIELEEIPTAGDVDDEDGPSFDPVYADSAVLDAFKPSLAERLLAVFAKILRRDDLDPPPEPFPLDDFEPSPKSKTASYESKAVKSSAVKQPVQPWMPEERKVELDHRPFQEKKKDRHKASDADSSEPWIPEAPSPNTRLGERALVFLLSAGLTLVVVGGGYWLFKKWSTQQAIQEAEISLAGITQDSFEKGIPIGIIVEKVHRMRQGSVMKRY